MRPELVALGFALLFAGIAHAWVEAPSVEVGETKLFFVSSQPVANVTDFDSVMAYNNGENWTGLNLTDEEKATVWEFIAHGYSVTKMTPEEYSLFLADATATNANLSTCDEYTAVAYREGFAGYVFTAQGAKEYPAPGIACPDAATGASTGAYLPFINDLPSGQPAPTPMPSPGEWAPSCQGTFCLGTAGAGEGTAGAAEKGSGHESSGIAGWADTARPYAAGGAVILVLAAFGAYVVITKRQGVEFEIPDAEMHRALSSDTRLGLMRELQARDLTPTDLSTRVGKSKATVVEHLDRLMDAGFVEKKEEAGRKFVFYGLTRKGKEILRQAG